MNSLWNEDDALAAARRYAADGIGEDLALRTYSARLLGADPALVLHGGGNTSVKTTAPDLFGQALPVLCVKGSGWDLATIEPAGHPAVRLAPLLALRALERLSDEAMVNAQRQNLMDSTAPNPSVETLLHAFIPEKFIDHTHSQAVLALADQPDAERVIETVYGPRVACVPYVMPGFDLARRAAAIWERHPGIEGLILINHGIFTFGATARESYERMIALVSLAEAHVAAHDRPRPRAAGQSLAMGPTVIPAGLSPVLRGVLGEAAGRSWPSHWLFDTRAGEAALAIANDENLADWARRGVATPDHVIRTKPWALALPPFAGDIGAWRAAAFAAVHRFMADYEAYFERNVARFAEGRTRLDPLPRVMIQPGLGLIGVGRDAAEAAVAADVAQSWAATLLAAESLGRFAPVGEAETFDMEYWSLEQAKLGKSAERRLARRVVVVTGGAGTIGAATARAFAAEGAQVAILDRDSEAARAVAASLGRGALGLACDVTDRSDVDRAMDRVAARFGGIDIVVSNAGTALAGPMATLGDADLRSSFEINFFGHQAVAQAAVRLMRAQGLGGALLFNVSKQALNPGQGFGAYGTAKAALLALMRQYALEHGADGVRANAINPDRIRSGLLTETMIAARSAARGVDAATYMSGNLLAEEVTAEDVAQAFVFAALMRRTTGAVITVDGGNVAAMVR
jgi:rhamnose utilization protein RhaD (predicted bifunctional aldolase and dehydrogenase)/NAD(P)-dependent dehydrogenase (short-subunit alcohol dehydrogenase family)